MLYMIATVAEWQTTTKPPNQDMTCFSYPLLGYVSISIRHKPTPTRDGRTKMCNSLLIPHSPLP